MLSDLEVLLNAERSLMDEDEPFDFGDWTTCTCGHIYHGVKDRYAASLEMVTRLDDDVYMKVMQKVTEVLGLEVEDCDYANAISDYTSEVSASATAKVTRLSYWPSREDALVVIREAIEKIREMDLIKIRDAHNYEVVNAPQSH